MITTLKTIRSEKLLEEGDLIGVGVSGGVDSMSLLHFLNQNKERFKIELHAIIVDHKMRKNSVQEVAFVKDYCKKNSIKFHKFEVDALELAEQEKLSKEEAARKARFGVFEALLQKRIVTKICLGHHLSDQAETVLLNLFRGSGLTGAKGMEVKRDSYIRPMLYTSREEIVTYAKQNEIPFITDESNLEDAFSRNYLRNQIMPLVIERFPAAEQNLVSFSRLAKMDDDYITSMVNADAMIKEEYYVKIPTSYFLYKEPLVNRMLRQALEHLSVSKDVEKKHIKLIKEMVKDAVNGVKISLPNKVTVHKEYDYITIVSKEKKYGFESEKLKSGVLEIRAFGKIIIKRTYEVDVTKGTHVVDVTKVPTNAVWRTRKEGDVFTKFGGGTKKLKDYFIDKKVPNRLRDATPVLAVGNEILIVAGLDISEQVKVDENTKSAYIINYETKH
jgi:tRNA(Ile)-lysidine synthase